MIFYVKFISFNLQTPTSKQSKYKEQVAEMRKGRNSGLQKEQKEKHMVHHYGLLTRSCPDTNHWFVSAVSHTIPYFFFCFPFASQEHRQTYGNTREPLLDNITSDYDLELFRKAQARASEDLVSVCLISQHVSHQHSSMHFKVQERS